MKHILLPNGLTVSEIALGAMNYGTTTSAEDAFAALDMFVEAGGTLIDTSNNYAHWQGTGDESETVLGQWLTSRGCRDRVVIATKVGFDRHGEGAGLRREQIEYWVDESLRKLQTDYIDLYYAHTDDPATPLEETMAAFDACVRKGKVRCLGGSNYDTWRFAEANAVAAAQGGTPYTVMQQRFSYLHHRDEIAPAYTFNESTNRERLRYLAAKDIPLVAYSCLCKGGYDRPDRLPDDVIGGERLALVQRLAREKGVSASAVVIAWMTQLHMCEGFPRIIPLFSAGPKHVAENLLGTEITLTADEIALMNRT